MPPRITHGMLLQQPWARLVAEGLFPVLVRSTATRIRGRVAIVARGFDENALVDGKPLDRKEFPHPATIGSVEIVGCKKVQLRDVLPALQKVAYKDFATFYPRHYLPSHPPAFLWILNKPRTLRKPRKMVLGGARKWVKLSKQ